MVSNGIGHLMKSSELRWFAAMATLFLFALSACKPDAPKSSRTATAAPSGTKEHHTKGHKKAEKKARKKASEAATPAKDA